ncbi:MAG: hypothetical protein SO183_05650 [Fusobacterium mortiferum]|nr:hypothetical protein [Fusobacterium mortiferum]MDY4801104.1 hypothetical protein [Fusobacterium mortiferum]MDY5980580.1 hypothetical protein [Fusobacterium mortiferum]
MSVKLTEKMFFKKLFNFSVASWLSAGISFFMTPFITRIYFPSEIGKINIFMTAVMFFQIVCTLSLDQALMRFYYENLKTLNRENILKYFLLLNFKIYMIMIPIIIGIYFKILLFDEIKLLICFIIVIGSNIFLRMVNVSFRIEKKVKYYIIQTVLISCVDKILLVIIGFYFPNHKDAIYTLTIGYIILVFLFVYIKSRELLVSIGNVSRTDTIEILKFSIPYVPVLLLSWLNSSIPLFILRKYLDYSAIGIYTSAITIANILTIVQTGFSAYWGPFIYEYYLDKENIQKIQKNIIIILMILSILIVIFQDYIFMLIGSKFRGSKVFFPFLMFTPICNVIGETTGIGIMLSKKSYLNIITFILGVTTNIIGSYLLIPIYGSIGAGISVSCSAVVILIIRSILGEKYYKISQNNNFIIFSVICFILVSFFNLKPLNFLGMNIIIIIFIFYIFIFRNEILKFLLVIREVKNFFIKLLK